MGHTLKIICTPRNGEISGPDVEHVSKCTVEAGPGPCLFEHRHQFTQTYLENRQFRILSYNLLADLYSDSDYSRTVLFPYCPAYALSIDYRKQLFIKEIVGYKSDIICLQEVDAKLFAYDLKRILTRMNYDGTFKEKGTTSEGLATFFNVKRFRYNVLFFILPPYLLTSFHQLSQITQGIWHKYW